jgi:hypothetical protein
MCEVEPITRDKIEPIPRQDRAYPQDRIGAVLRVDTAILKGSVIKDSTIPLYW